MAYSLPYPIRNPCAEIMLPMLKAFHITDSALVDGKQWYRIIAANVVTDWLRQQDGQYYHKHGNATINFFDISEDLLIVMKLKWAI
jgi:hypothetical protein